MADGAVRSPPYDAIGRLLGYVTQPGRWHEFDGELTTRGIDPRRLPLDRFLNLVYWYMIQRLPPTDERRDPRGELDGVLGVTGWETPYRRSVRYVREPGVPSWWHGDEDASQTFLTAMGVKI